jgi:WD40 repeat protein
MSANAFGSDWTKLESYTFRFRDPLNTERRFIPLRLDDAPIKGSLAQFLYVDWCEENREAEYLKLVTSVQPDAHAKFAERIDSLRHTAAVQSVAFSPNGACALSGSEDRTLRLWDLETGRCLRVLEGHTARVWSVAWSPDGHQVLSGSGDNTVRLWDLETGRCLRVLEGHTATVFSVAWSPDGHQALSSSQDRTVRLWDLKTGSCLRVLMVTRPECGVQPGVPMAVRRSPAQSTKPCAGGISRPAAI